MLPNGLAYHRWAPDASHLGRRVSLVGLSLLGGVLAMLAVLSAGMTAVSAEERWVSSIATSQEWAAFPCRSYLVTKLCAIEKDYSDPGLLPPTISVGDTVKYTNKKGEHKEFVVRHISFFVFDKDNDTTYGGQRLRAKKGDTSCFLYDAASRAATRDTEYPSKIIVKGCRGLR